MWLCKLNARGGDASLHKDGNVCFSRGKASFHWEAGMRSKLRKVPRMTSFKELLEHSVSHHGEKDGFKELDPR